MSFHYEISNAAIEDIENIWHYTVEQWSVDHANKYYELIFKEIARICQNPNIGKSIKHVKLSHRILQVESHLIIYKKVKETIYIDRVLYKNMDLERNLT
jgi:toxin ParE1/3/4